MNKIGALLNRVAETGDTIASEDWENLLTRGSNNDRAYARKRIQTAAKQIRGLLRGDLDTDGDIDVTIAEIIEDTSAELHWVTAAEPGVATAAGARELAAEIEKHKDGGTGRTREQAAADYGRMRSLRDSILSAARFGGGVDDRDFAGFQVKSGTDQAKWREDVRKAAQRAGQLHGTGNQMAAARAAEDAARRLVQHLAADERRDPLADEMDPRVLADAIINRQTLNG